MMCERMYRFRSIRIINLIENVSRGILFIFLQLSVQEGPLLSLVDLCWWPVPLLRWSLIDQLLPGAPTQHFTSQDQFILCLYDKFFDLSAADFRFDVLYVGCLQGQKLVVKGVYRILNRVLTERTILFLSLTKTSVCFLQEVSAGIFCTTLMILLYRTPRV